MRSSESFTTHSVVTTLDITVQLNAIQNNSSVISPTAVEILAENQLTSLVKHNNSWFPECLLQSS